MDIINLPPLDLDALDRAQEMFIDALEMPFGKKSIALAKKALTVSPYCTDAYCYLADVDTKDPRKKLELFRKGAIAGKIALGDTYFEEDVGYFWSLDETRPYMRALEGMANTYWLVGKREEAILQLKEMLRLNPNDNQGVRYALLSFLIELNRDDEAERLLLEYEGDTMAVWEYGAALLSFRREGDTIDSVELACEAIITNPHVVKHLSGQTKTPAKDPAYYGLGDDSEAIVTVHLMKNSWKSTPGSIDWLVRCEKEVESLG